VSTDVDLNFTQLSSTNDTRRGALEDLFDYESGTVIANLNAAQVFFVNSIPTHTGIASFRTDGSASLHTLLL
jgi:hypothetical protein